ncbi:MAG: hypothetical protein AAF366_16650 [Pseudomonadota bacterium]
MARDEDGPVASYFIQWTEGQPLDSHPANVDLICGRWGEGTTGEDRCAISLVRFENEAGPGVMVVDAQDRPVARSDLVGRALSREEVVGTDLAQEAYAIFDAVLIQDTRLG